MGLGLKHRNAFKIQGVSVCGLEGAYSPLAENDIWISACDDVFSSHKELLERRCHSSLEDDWIVNLSQFLEKVEVLHVSRSHPKNIYVFGADWNIPNIHDLGLGEYADLIPCHLKQFQAFYSHPLEFVGRGSGLKRGCAHYFYPILLHDPGAFQDLLLLFDRVRPCNHGEIRVPYLHAADLD